MSEDFCGKMVVVNDEKPMEWKEKRVSLGNAIISCVVVGIVLFAVGLNFNGWFGKYLPYLGFDAGGDPDWSELNEIYDKLATTYNGDISKEQAVEGAKKGLTESLGDVYTVYMDAKEAEQFEDDLHGNVGAGIGVEMGLRDGYVRVLRTLPDNPARKAGILAGDILYKVNGEEVYNLTTDEITNKVRGEVGTDVEITVVRDGKEKTFKMKRETINNVSAYVNYSGKTAIVTLTRFDEDTGRLVEGFTNDFKDKGVNKIILDLRGNGGGYVTAAQDLLSLWLDGDNILLQKSKHFGDSDMKARNGKAILKDMKTIVLVNGSTASASEIVAGALQDYKKATIVGEKTYGKGVVQNLYNISNGSKLKVTTAAWYTPKDRSINGTGITPDVEVERTFEDINAMRDPQMDKAKKL